MKRSSVILVSIASLNLIHSPAAWACFCSGGNKPLIPAYNATTAVFVATVTSLREAVGSGRLAGAEKILIAYLDVDEAFKGVATRDVAVMTDANHTGGCGIHFEVGEQYLVFAGTAPGIGPLEFGIGLEKRVDTSIPMRTPTLATSICNQSGPMSYQRRAATMIRNYRSSVPRPQIDGLVGVYGYELDGAYTNRFRGIRDLAVVATSNGQRFDTQTDELGTFLFENLPLGKYTVSAQLPAPYPQAVETVLLESVEQREELNLFARPTAQLRGQLLDSAGNPLETSVALSLIPFAASGQQSHTNSLTLLFSAGRFHFRDVPPGKYILGVSPFIPTPNAPYPRIYYPRGSSVEAAEVFDVKLGVIDNLVFKLPAPLDNRPLTGVAVAADGDPVSNAQVLLYDVEMPSRLAAGIQLTDSAGRFRLFGLPGRRYLLQARKFTDFSASRGLQSRLAEVTVGEASQEVRLLLDQEASLQIQLK